MCIGKDSAYLQMKMTTILLLKYFSFEIIKGHSLKYSMMVVLYMAHGLKMNVSLR
jgi:cytochrome P450